MLYPLFKRAALLASIVFSTHISLCGQDHKTPDLARVVLAEHTSRRHLLRSGQFTATGSLEETSPDWGRLQGVVKLLCAFDFTAGKLRFDRTSPVRAPSNPDVAPTGPRDWVPRINGGQYIRREDAFVIVPRGQKIASILPPTRTPPDWVKPFDIRVIGIGHQHDIDWGVSFGRIQAIYARQPVYQVSEEADSVYRLDWQVQRSGSKYPDFQRSVWFDGKKDYWPIRLEMRGLKGVRKKKKLILLTDSYGAKPHKSRRLN